MRKLDLTGVRVYTNAKDDVRDAINLVGERVYLSDDANFDEYEEAELEEVKYANDVTYPFLEGKGISWFRYIVRAEDVKSKKEKKTNVNIEEEMNFIKTWKSCVVPFSSELPPKGVKVDIGTKVAVPGEKQGQFKIFTWFNDDWVWTSTIDSSDSELSELEGAHDDLENAIRKLSRVSRNTKDDELSSKLSKITTEILQAKCELSDDVVEPFKNS